MRDANTEEEAPEWREQLANLEQDATAWSGNDTRIVEYGEGDLADATVRPVIEAALLDGIELSGSRRRLRSLLDGQAL